MPLDEGTNRSTLVWWELRKGHCLFVTMHWKSPLLLLFIVRIWTEGTKKVLRYFKPSILLLSCLFWDLSTYSMGCYKWGVGAICCHHAKSYVLALVCGEMWNRNVKQTATTSWQGGLTVTELLLQRTAYLKHQTMPQYSRKGPKLCTGG